MNKDLLPKDKKPLYRGSSPWETDGPLGREMQADSMKGGRAIKVWAALREASREGKPSELRKAGAPLTPGPEGVRGSRGVELWMAALPQTVPSGEAAGGTCSHLCLPVHSPRCPDPVGIRRARSQVGAVWEVGFCDAQEGGDAEGSPGRGRRGNGARWPPALAAQSSCRSLSLRFFWNESNTSLPRHPSCGTCTASSLGGPTGSPFPRLRKKCKHPYLPFGVKRPRIRQPPSLRKILL